jgi:acetylornithine deacetylase/succinyl-diaminopimelate desuccinylase-like protein
MPAHGTRTALLFLVALALHTGARASEFAAAAPERLVAYLRIDTINPPGNESRGVAFLAAVLQEAGIDYQTAESAPGRGNLWARLEGGDAPALVLLHHIDVVPADPRYWTTDPLGGEIRDGYVWGRGALDMKGTGIMQLQAFLALHAAGRPLSRDVILVATADEEAGGRYGAGWLLEHHPEIFANAGFLLNEGGSGGRVGEQLVFNVEVTQKVPLWLRLTARGNPGHGSTPQATTAVTRLLRAGDRIAETAFPARVLPAVASMFEALAPFQPPELKGRYANPAAAVADDDFLRYLQQTNPGAHALLRNTCSITRLAGSDKINVVPTEASMELDCRLLPDQDPGAFIDDLAVVVNDPQVEIETLMSFTPAVTGTDTPLYRAINAGVAERHPDAVVIPSVSTGFTDSHFFRDRGIVSYGFSPVVVPPEDRGGVHGNNERIAVDSLVDGTRFMIDLLQRFATAP